MPVIINEKAVAIVGTDIDFDVFSQMVKDVKVYDTGYAFLVGDNYRFIVHPSIDTTETIVSLDEGAFQFTIPIIEANETGTIKYHFGVDKIMGFSRLYNGWILAVAPPLSEVYSDLNQMRFQMIVITVLSVCSVFVIADKVSIVITKPIMELTHYVEHLNDPSKKLSLPKNLSNDKTEVGYLGYTIEQMNNELNKAYVNMADQNKALDIMVTNRTYELSESNTELRFALESLEETQSKLIKAEKHAALRTLIQNLAHRLNTPLGNTITTSSFLKNMMNDPEKVQHKDEACYQDCSRGLEIIINAQSQMSEIVDSLSFLLLPYEEESVSTFNIKKLIESTVATFDMTHGKQNVNIDLQCSFLSEVTSYYNLVESLINYLLLHSCNIRTANEAVELIIRSEISETQCTLYYFDPHINKIGEHIEIFDPFSTAGFNASETGIEMFIVYDIVSRGLSGIIEQVDEGLKITFKQMV